MIYLIGICGVFFILLIPSIFAEFEHVIGFGASGGHGSPLKWDAEIGPWAGGFNARCAAGDFDQDGDVDLIVDYPYGGGAVNTMWGSFFYRNTGSHVLTNADRDVYTTIYEHPVRLEFCGLPIAYDWNHDGRIDIVSGGKIYINHGNCQFSESQYQPKFPENVKWIGDWNNDGVVDCIRSEKLGGSHWPSPAVWLPGEPPYNDDGIWKGGPLRNTLRFYKGIQKGKSIQWEDKGILAAAGTELEVYGGGDPTLGDWDKDEDLDLIVGSQTELTYFENTGSSNEPKLARGKRVMVGDDLSLSGIFLRPVACDVNKTGFIDLLLAQENGSVTWLKYSGFDQRSVPSFEPERELMQKNTYLDVGCLSVLSVCDWDNDNDLDILSGNSYGDVFIFENTGDGKNHRFNSRERLTAGNKLILIKGGANGSIQGPGEAHFGYTCPVAVDWNRDGFMDLILSDIWGKYVYYERDPASGELKNGVTVRVHGGPVESYKPEWVWWEPENSELVTQWRCQPAVVDWNNDDVYDLISLDSKGYLTLFQGVESDSNPTVISPERIFLLANNDPIRITNGVGGRSGRARIVVADWNEDGYRDLIRGCTHAGDHEDPNFADYERVAVWYENTGDDSHFIFRGSLLKDVQGISFCGHATSPAIVDWDHDGQLDLLLGTEDGLIYFFKHSLLSER